MSFTRASGCFASISAARPVALGSYPQTTQYWMLTCIRQGYPSDEHAAKSVGSEARRTSSGSRDRVLYILSA